MYTVLGCGAGAHCTMMFLFGIEMLLFLSQQRALVSGSFPWLCLCVRPTGRA
jgi:hypothetical protein